MKVYWSDMNFRADQRKPMKQHVKFNKTILNMFYQVAVHAIVKQILLDK